MGETENAPTGETPEGAQTPQPETGTTPPVTGETPETTTPLSEDPGKEVERLKAALSKVNAEAAKHRHAAKELAELKEQIEAEKLSEKERLEKKLADSQAQINDLTLKSQERIISAELRIQAQRLGIAHPDRAVRLIDRAGLEFDDEGMPTNAEALLQTLLKEMPELAGTGSRPASSGGATNPPRSQGTTPPALSWEVIGKMTQQEYESRRAEIQQWMLSNPNTMRFGQRSH